MEQIVIIFLLIFLPHKLFCRKKGSRFLQCPGLFAEFSAWAITVLGHVSSVAKPGR